jgi:multidrug efflux pump
MKAASRGVLKRKIGSAGVYALLAVAAGFMFKVVPSGFVPAQDKQYLVGFAQLPDAASLDRTEAVIRKMSDIATEGVPGVESSIAFPGLSINGFTNAPNAGIVFTWLKPFDQRTGKGQSGRRDRAGNQQAPGRDPGRLHHGVPATAGQWPRYHRRLQDDGRRPRQRGLRRVVQIGAGAADEGMGQTPKLAGVFSSFQINVPQLFADVDRVKAKQLGVPLQTIYQTLQINLGSLYVNDFNQFGRTYQVRVQADAPVPFAGAEDISQLKVRNDKGEMIPLSSLMRVKDSYGPDRVQRYNAYVSADINGGAAPGVSSGQAQAALEKIAKEVLPKGVIGFEWTDLTYQDILSGNTMMLCSRCACCWCSWCWPRSTKAGPCRWR